MNRPGKIVCVGRNYREHAKEMGNDVPAEPLIFLKPPSSFVRHGEPIKLPGLSRQVEFEGEIGLLIGRPLRHVRDDAAAWQGVRAIVAVNDVTARDLQKRDGQWTRAKGFDTFCPVGSLGDIPANPARLSVVTRVNGVERQRATAADMVFDIPTLIRFISTVMTLEPGDLVATGTPAGVGPIVDGDVVEVEIEGVSRVSNPVHSER